MVLDVNFLNFFAGKGYRALALSLRGHGNSPTDKPLRACSVADFVEDINRGRRRPAHATGRYRPLHGRFSRAELSGVAHLSCRVSMTSMSPGVTSEPRCAG